MLPHKKHIESPLSSSTEVKINDNQSDDIDGKVVMFNLNELKKIKIVNTNISDSNSISVKEETNKNLTNEKYKLPPLSLLDELKKTKTNNQPNIESNIRRSFI